MKLLGRRGHHALVYDDGTLAGEPGRPRRRLWRAIGPRLPHVHDDHELVHLIDADATDGYDVRIWHATIGAAARIDHAEGRWTCRFPYRPGVFLIDVLAQGSVEGGLVPVDAAVAIVVAVARAVARVHGLDRRSGAPLPERVRVGFDGDSALWLFNSAADDQWDNRIQVSPRGMLQHLTRGGDAARDETHDDDVVYDSGVYDDDDDDDDGDDGDDDGRGDAVPPVLAGDGRSVGAPRGEPSSPEEALGEDGGRPADVFGLGALLWWVLSGAHPFARSDRLTSRDALAAAALPPMTRTDVPAPLLRLLRGALARSPADRPSAATFAESLALFVDVADGRAAVARLARGLFPGTAEADASFVEEAAIVDLEQLLPPGLLPSGRVNVPSVPIASAVRLVSHREVIESFDRRGRTLPPGFPLDPLLDGRPATMLSWTDAVAVAADLGGRLPTEAEWSALSRGGSFGVPSACGVGELCLCWEWTSTPSHPAQRGHSPAPPQSRGRIVRGGPWRNRQERALIDNRSWEDEAAGDVGFRVVFDRTMIVTWPPGASGPGAGDPGRSG